jgi:predicted nucleic acid-binding protein
VRVFLDTNVLASAFGSRGLCADLVRLLFAEHELVTSEFVLDELNRTLRDKFGVPEATVQEILALLRGHHVQSAPEKLLSIMSSPFAPRETG